MKAGSLSLPLRIFLVITIGSVESRTSLTELGPHHIREIRSALKVLSQPSNPCDRSESPLVIAIKAAPYSADDRKALRDTYLVRAKIWQVPYMFFVGTTANKTLNHEILTEAQQHQDIVTADFIDDYYNLTLKSISAINWVNRNCVHRWLMMADLDSLLNIDELLYFTGQLDKQNERRIYGWLSKDSRPQRLPWSKWYMPPEIWPGDHYPTYVQGMAYLISPKAVQIMASLSTDPITVPKVRFEDLYLNGIVAERAKIERIQKFRKCYGCESDGFQRQLAIIEVGKGSELREAWNKVVIAEKLARDLEQMRILSISTHPDDLKLITAFLIVKLSLILIGIGLLLRIVSNNFG